MSVIPATTVCIGKRQIEVAQGSRDVDSASTELQKTWDMALPVL